MLRPELCDRSLLCQLRAAAAFSTVWKCCREDWSKHPKKKKIPTMDVLFNSNSSDCLLSDAESSSSDSPVADKRAPGSERAAERAAQQNERERIRLAPQTSFANMQVNTCATNTYNDRHFPWYYKWKWFKKKNPLFSGIWLWTEKAVGN